MRLSESSHRRLELFFRDSLNDENFRLPAINIYAGRFSRLLTSTLRIDGITFGRHIFILPHRVEKNSKNKLKLCEELAAHEIAHTLQYRREGFIKFLYKYLKSYRLNLRKKGKRDSYAKFQAYFEIPFEIEARQMAENFRLWNKNVAKKETRAE
jgi:hypothetical protein